MEPIEDLYFNWLCAKVVNINSRNHIDLLQILHNTEFVWVVSFDRHRAADGIELREDFLRETGVEPDSLWNEEPCSIFEMLIAFAKRAQFQTEIPTKDWFWEFITNLQLEELRQVPQSSIPLIYDILNVFMYRTYQPNGYGGICPLRRSENDQREIEIWYQWCEYVDERGLI